MKVISCSVKDYSLEKSQEEECITVPVRLMNVLRPECTECIQAKIPIQKTTERLWLIFLKHDELIQR